jgi:hypothetical protein
MTSAPIGVSIGIPDGTGGLTATDESGWRSATFFSRLRPIELIAITAWMPAVRTIGPGLFINLRARSEAGATGQDCRFAGARRRSSAHVRE